MKNIGYFFSEGCRNMLTHGFMSFAAVGITVACLLIMGTFSLVAYNANVNLEILQRENAVGRHLRLSPGGPGRLRGQL